MSDYHKIIEQLNHGPIYLFTVVSGSRLGEKMILSEDQIICNSEQDMPLWEQAAVLLEQSRCPYRYQIQGTDIFVERLVQEPELVICGGGHVSLELAAMADYLEYPYTVIDDRYEFANRDRFVNAKECLCMSYSEALTTKQFSRNAYYVIVTRGHMHDLECLDLVLQKSYGYAGMIGSRSKVKQVMDNLLKKGYSEAVLKTVHTPIGLPIGGQTPKEIAISIIGELIQEKYQENPSSYLESDVKAALQQKSKAVLVRIIEKRGSAPRGVGSRMLVDETGVIAGTIGGGKVEFMAVEFAKQLVETGKCAVKSYRLNNDTAASLGMWCGGEVDVLFES